MTRLPRTRRARSLIPVVIVVSVLASTIGFAVSPETAAAGVGYRLASTTVYRLDPETPAVRVEATYEMTNTKPDVKSGGSTQFFYFTGVTVPIYTGATEVSVQVNGQDAAYEIVEDRGLSALDVTYRSNLRYQRTATTVVRYTLPSVPPRTDDSFIRVNPAYASFPVYAWADDGLASVRIEIPISWVHDYVGGTLTSATFGQTRILSIDNIDRPSDFGIAFTARNDERLTSSSLSAGDANFEIRSWPGDTAWADFATSQVTAGVPILERLIGLPWPESRETDVIEASTPYLRGYAGYYYAEADVIEMAEDLDSLTMQHELSHAWFNGSSFVERWISEGLAEEVGSRVTAELGEPIPELEPGVTPDEVAPFPLNTWDAPDEIDDPREPYGYATSFTVMRALFDEIGEEKMGKLLASAVQGTRAYRGEGGAVTGTGTVDWKEFLDLAEQIGGSQELEALYRDYVLTPAQEVELDVRSAAVVDYEALVARGETWAAPEVVNLAMTHWLFDRSDGLITEANAVLDIRDALGAALDPLDLEPSAAIEAEYQEVLTSFDEVTNELEAQLEAARELVVHRSELTGVLAAEELDVPELTQLEYNEDPVAIVETAADMVDDARALSAAADDLAEVLDELGVVMPPVLDARSFVDDRDGALQRVEDQLEVATLVATAHQKLELAGSFTEWVGSIGRDIEGQLYHADGLLTSGDNDEARTIATAALDDIEDLRSSGTTRLRIGGPLLGGLVLSGLLALVLRRRRPRESSETEASDPSVGLDSDDDGPQDPSAQVEAEPVAE